MSLIGDSGGLMGESSPVLRQLKDKVKRLKNLRSRLVRKLDKKIEKLEGAIEVLEEEKNEDILWEQQSLLDEANTTSEKEGYPQEGTLRDKITWALKEEEHAMRPKQIDAVLRTVEGDLRKNAVAETVSHMAKKGNLYRKKYSGRSHYYGLPEWKDEEKDDFREPFLPES